jgi:CHASE3 domain sensor protein
MSAFANLNISLKLALSFGAILTLLLSLGALSIFEIREIKSRVAADTGQVAGGVKQSAGEISNQATALDREVVAFLAAVRVA